MISSVLRRIRLLDIGASGTPSPTVTGLIGACKGTSVRFYKQHKYRYLRELYNRRSKAGLPEVIPQNKRHNWNYDVELHAFTQRISATVSPYTLQLAFTDKSYGLQMKKLEMELIGEGQREAIVDDDIFSANDQLANAGMGFTLRYIEEYLVSELPHLPSEGIQALVGYLTSANMLAHIGENLGMSDLVLYDGHPVAEEAVVKSLLALIAIIKDEQDVSSAQSFVRDFIVTQLVGEDVDDIYHMKNGMAQLEQVLDKQGWGKPEPRLIEQFGQETLVACYYVGIYSDKKLIGKAPGETPEVATEMAARDALMTIYGIQDNKTPFNFDKEYRLKLESTNNPHLLNERSTAV